MVQNMGEIQLLSHYFHLFWQKCVRFLTYVGASEMPWCAAPPTFCTCSPSPTNSTGGTSPTISKSTHACCFIRSTFPVDTTCKQCCVDTICSSYLSYQPYSSLINLCSTASPWAQALPSVISKFHCLHYPHVPHCHHLQQMSNDSSWIGYREHLRGCCQSSRVWAIGRGWAGLKHRRMRIKS